MPVPRCLTCENVGQVIEFRLIWQEPREELPPVKCSRRVESSADGWERAALLPSGAVSVDVVSAARRCPRCAQAEAKRVEQAKRAEQAQRVEPAKPAIEKARPPQGTKARSASPLGRAFQVASPPVRDWKMAQAGDR